MYYLNLLHLEAVQKLIFSEKNMNTGISCLLLRLLLLYGLHEAIAQCPTGTSPIYSNNQMATCSPQSRCTCTQIRPGSFCQFASQYNKYICCGASSSQCSKGSPLLSDIGQIVTCSSSTTCGQDFTCTQGVCCAESVPEQCTNNNGQCLAGQVYVNGKCITQVQLGALCQSNEQCTGEAQCISGRCQCPTGYIASNGICIMSACQLGTTMINGQCMSLASPGSQCVANAQCIDNSQCINSICSCQTGSTNVNGYCIPYSANGCLPSQTLINGACVTYSIVGGSCIADIQCVGGTTCQNAVCQCKSGSVAMYGYCIQDVSSGTCNSNQIGIDGNCYNKVPQGGFCMLTQQCLNNGQCVNGVCQANACSTNQVSVNGKCYTYANIGSSCEVSGQCLGSSRCINSVCQCPSGGSSTNGQCPNNPCGNNAVLISNQCYSLVELGYSCVYTQQCLGAAECRNSVCQATSTGTCGSNNVLIGSQCYPTAQIGSFCYYTQQCLGNSQCSNGYCQCPSGSYQQNGVCTQSGTSCGSNGVLIGNQCFPTVQIGASCYYTQQCLGNSQCSNGYCLCPAGTSQQNGVCTQGGSTSCGPNNILIGNQCFPTVQIGASCYYTQQCLGNSQCSNGICQCPSGTSQQNGVCTQGGSSCGSNGVLIGNQCFPTVQIGASCYYTQQCLGNSQCSNGYCLCPAGTSQQNGVCTQGGSSCGSNGVLIGNQCFPTVQIGASCYYTQQCLGNSQCSNGYCLCPAGTSQQNGVCTQGGSTSCGPNNVLIGNQCFPTVQIGASCYYTQQCLGNSQCSNGYCLCPAGTSQQNGVCTQGGSTSCGSNNVLIGNQCFPTVQIGASCYYTQQCLGNSQCSNGICQCPSGSSVSNGQCLTSCGSNGILINNTCLSRVNYGGACYYTQQCLQNSECISQKCQCPSGREYINGNCSQSCKSYQVRFNTQCLDKVSIGQSCTIDGQCQVNGTAICQTTCRCASGSTFNGTSCRTGITACAVGTVNVNNQCLSLTKLGQSCQYSAQCLGFGVCSGTLCACAPNYTNQNGVCRSNSELASCTSDQVLINGACYSKIKPGNSCMFTQQCTGSSTCQSNICKCPANTADFGDGVCRGSSFDQPNYCSTGEEPVFSNGELGNCYYQACPSASYCKYSNQISQYICCKKNSSAEEVGGLTCSNAANSVVYQNGSPINCLYNNCPANSYCEYSNSASQYICCQSGSAAVPVQFCKNDFQRFGNGTAVACETNSDCPSEPFSHCLKLMNSFTSVCCSE